MMASVMRWGTFARGKRRQVFGSKGVEPVLQIFRCATTGNTTSSTVEIPASIPTAGMGKKARLSPFLRKSEIDFNLIKHVFKLAKHDDTPSVLVAASTTTDTADTTHTTHTTTAGTTNTTNTTTPDTTPDTTATDTTTLTKTTTGTTKSNTAEASAFDPHFTLSAEHHEVVDVKAFAAKPLPLAARMLFESISQTLELKYTPTQANTLKTSMDTIAKVFDVDPLNTVMASVRHALRARLSQRVQSVFDLRETQPPLSRQQLKALEWELVQLESAVIPCVVRSRKDLIAISPSMAPNAVIITNTSDGGRPEVVPMLLSHIAQTTEASLMVVDHWDFAAWTTKSVNGLESPFLTSDFCIWSGGAEADVTTPEASPPHRPNEAPRPPEGSMQDIKNFMEEHVRKQVQQQNSTTTPTTSTTPKRGKSRVGASRRRQNQKSPTVTFINLNEAPPGSLPPFEVFRRRGGDAPPEDESVSIENTISFLRYCLKSLAMSEADSNSETNRGILLFRGPTDDDGDCAWFSTMTDALAIIMKAPSFEKEFGQVSVVLHGIKPGLISKKHAPQVQEPAVDNEDKHKDQGAMLDMVMGLNVQGPEAPDITADKRVVHIDLGAMPLSLDPTVKANLDSREHQVMQRFNQQQLGFAMLRLGLLVDEADFDSLEQIEIVDKFLSPAAAQTLVRQAFAHKLVSENQLQYKAGEAKTPFLSPKLFEPALASMDTWNASGGGSGGVSGESLTKREKKFMSCIIPKDQTKTSFNQVATLDYAKQKLQEFVMLPMQQPDLFNHGILSGGCKGVLLYGPPGTGKTLLAKAVASEAGANFLHITQASLASMWYGEASKNAKAIFTLARKLSPCVMFIDEVESIFESRNDLSKPDKNVMTEMLQQWDGLPTTTDESVMLLGATNRPYDLDEAVLRRFPRRILIDLPDESGREEILKVLLLDNKIDSDVCLKTIAADAKGFSGSDLRDLSYEAALNAARRHVAAAAATATTTSSSPSEISFTSSSTSSSSTTSSSSSPTSTTTTAHISVDDFAAARKVTKPSVNATSASNRRLSEWNEQYGDLKKPFEKTWGFAVPQ